MLHAFKQYSRTISLAGLALLVTTLFVFVVPRASVGASVPGPVAIVHYPEGSGYWKLYADGSVESYGQATNFGGTSQVKLNDPIVGMVPTPDGNGYWLVASDGGVFTFGDAGFFGSMGGIPLNKPIVGMAATADGGGYWLLGADGGIFSFGDAPFYGTDPGVTVPAIGITTQGDIGYQIAYADGSSVFLYDMKGGGQPALYTLNAPIVGVVSDEATKDGYWLVAADGGVFSYGGAPFYGSLANVAHSGTVVGMEANSDGSGYTLLTSTGATYSLGAPDYGQS